jgi:2-polyprenyl-6-methoxyphenol hydroxylase-like FAD-dependent oxidoreductase
MGLIAGEVTLSRDQYLRQFALARSMWMATAKDFRFFLGLKQLAPDLSTAEYYWLVSWADEAASKPGFWMETASPEEQLAFTKEKVKDIHEDLREILNYQVPERMLKPFVIRDLVPEVPPSGPVTLLGDAAHPMSPCM